MSHTLIAHSQRSGKYKFAKDWAEGYARKGEHVHFGMETCYNGRSYCDKFVEKRLHWNGKAFASPGGENGDK